MPDAAKQPNSQSILYSIYKIAINIGAVFYKSSLKKRVKNGKEDALRYAERFAQTSFTRPNGKLIWFHGASVGETKIGLGLADKLREQNPELKFLFTSQTKTAADIIGANIQKDDIHQYFPLDKLEYVEKFLNHWKPDAAIFLEGEIWPNMLMTLRNRNIPTALINARMTVKSIRTWLRYSGFARQLFSAFGFAHAANELTAQAIGEFGFVGHIPIGNLKNAANAPIINQAAIDDLKFYIKDRATWLAASTHNGEEELVLKAHEIIKMASKNPLLILAPRHIERTEAIILLAQKMGLKIARRSQSQNQVPDENIDLFLWDTMGELGNAFSLCDVSLICGSLVANIGGHNPIEPAQIGCAIISGQYVHNFQDVYDEMEKCGAAKIINSDVNNIAINISGILFDSEKRGEMTKNAAQYVAQSADNITKTIVDFDGWLKDKIP